MLVCNQPPSSGFETESSWILNPALSYHAKTRNNKSVAEHATSTQASFGTATSTFSQESSKLNKLSSEVLELMHSQRNRLKRAVGETAREQDRLAKAFEKEIFEYQSEAQRASQEAAELREKLEREYRAKQSRDETASKVLKGKDEKIKRLQEEIDVMIDNRRKKQENEEAERLQQERLNEEKLEERVGKAIEAQEKLQVLEQAYANVKEELAEQKVRAAELESEKTAMLKQNEQAIKLARRQAEDHLREREECWQRERDGWRQEKEQYAKDERAKLENSKAEGMKELSRARQAVARFKETLAAAKGENKRLQSELESVLTRVAEMESAAAAAAAKDAVDCKSKSTINYDTEYIRRLEMTIEDLLSRELNRRIKGRDTLRSEKNSIAPSTSMTDVKHESKEEESKNKASEQWKEQQQRPKVKVVQPALKEAKEVRTELRKEFQSAIDTEVRLLSKSVETFKRNQLGKIRDLIKEAQKARRERKRASDDLKAAKAALEDLRGRHITARDTLASLKETVAVLDSALTEKETNNRSLLIEISNLQRALRNANCKGTLTTIASSSSLKQEFGQRLKESRESAKSLTKANEIMRSSLVARDYKISDLGASIVKLTKDLERETEARGKAEARCAELEARVALGESHATAAADAMAELQRAKMADAYGIAEAKAEADFLREQNAALAKTNGEVQLDLLEARGMIAALQQQYESAAAKQRMREEALAVLREQVRDQQGALDVLGRDEDVQRATARATKLARDCKALHFMVTQMASDRIAFFSAVEGGAPFLGAVDSANSRLKRLMQLVSKKEEILRVSEAGYGKEQEEDKEQSIQKRVHNELIALNTELLAPALHFRKAFRKALARFKKNKKE